MSANSNLLMINSLIKSYSNAKGHTRGLISAVIGFFFYGGWAYFVNFNYGSTVAIKAFMTQGLISFSITLVLTQFMEMLYKQFSSSTAAYWFTAILTSTLVVMISFTVNLIVGTPEILLTILPGGLISACYSFGYAGLLRHIHRPQN